MDPRTVLAIATLIMLLNGGVLGLMHRSLSPDVQPSAVDWRIGTLLAAGGSALLAVQNELPLGFILPVSNGLGFLATALYWRAVRRFHALPATRYDTLRYFLPAQIGITGIYWFAAVMPSLKIRMVIAGAVLGFYALAAAWSLYRARRSQRDVSGTVLAGIFVFAGTFFMLRSVYVLVYPQAVNSILDGTSWLNVVTPFVAGALAIIGTTAFLVMCSERLRRQWERAAATDYLTGLPNRRTISGSGETRFHTARRKQKKFAAAVIDIDHFKSINDRFGHDVGDLALKHVATVLEHHCRGPHMVGRQGGEEFVALFEDANPVEAKAAAERLRSAIEQSPLEWHEALLQITISIGVGTLQPNDRNFDDVLRRADLALYAAKQGGRNRVALDVPV